MAKGTRATTLTLGASATNLLTAIKAVSGYSDAQDGCTFINVRGDDSLSTNFIYVGDANLTTSTYATKLAVGVTLPLVPGVRYGVSLSNLYVLGSTTGLKVNVQWCES